MTLNHETDNQTLKAIYSIGDEYNCLQIFTARVGEAKIKTRILRIKIYPVSIHIQYAGVFYFQIDIALFIRLSFTIGGGII